MKAIVARIVCFIMRRHNDEYMESQGVGIHNFYGVSGAGKMCICPKCGKFIFMKVKK